MEMHQLAGDSRLDTGIRLLLYRMVMLLMVMVNKIMLMHMDSNLQVFIWCRAVLAYPVWA